MYDKIVKLSKQINKNVQQQEREITVQMQTPEGNTFKAELEVVEGLPKNLVMGYNVLCQMHANDLLNTEALKFSVNLSREK